MAAIADVKTKLTALEVSVTNLEVRAGSLPPPVATQADLDEVAGRVDAVKTRVDAVLP